MSNEIFQTWHVIHGAVSVDDLKGVINMSNQFGADYVYVAENNLYDKPPSYWTTEKDLVKP